MSNSTPEPDVSSFDDDHDRVVRIEVLGGRLYHDCKGCGRMVRDTGDFAARGGWTVITADVLRVLDAEICVSCCRVELDKWRADGWVPTGP